MQACPPASAPLLLSTSSATSLSPTQHTPQTNHQAVAVKAYDVAALGCHGLRRLLLEQRILTTVQHPHIIWGLGSFQEGGHCFLVMEHAGGRNLLQFIEYWHRRNQVCEVQQSWEAGRACMPGVHLVVRDATALIALLPFALPPPA